MGAQQQHKPGAPVVGFNHNLSHKGRTFHVQTEDSGPQHGHIITHVFMGGNIFASTKSSYADLLPTIEPGEIFATVRRLMEEQHKAMMRSLVQGRHDEEIERRTGGNIYEPGVLADGAKAPGLLVGGEKKPAEGAVPPAPNVTPQAPRTPTPAAVTPVSTPRPTPPVVARPVLTPSSVAPVRPAASKPPPLSRMAPPTRPPPPRVESRASAADPSLFGDGLISEKSLDEVILSYLAADLEGPKR